MAYSNEMVELIYPFKELLAYQESPVRSSYEGKMIQLNVRLYHFRRF